ncbi:MAG TPA: FliM/FliN family flagellar motor C-terminal domain-containing protein [Paracoccaceae bacterium]|nr:FliM/FliN family flagellar motor C-terminal domain-containing protein [Paracoccaceae bacterium]
MGGIARKLAAQAGSAADTGPGDAAAALPAALARGARLGGGGLDAAAARADLSRADPAEVIELVPDHALILSLEGPRGAAGAMVLSAEVVAAVIEHQTLGRVGRQPLVPRRPTRTDAMLAAGLAGAVLAALDEARMVGFHLEDTPHRLWRAEVDLGAGARRGTVMLALPAAGRGEPPASAVVAAEQAAALVFRAALTEQVMAAEAVLDAVLARVSLPLAQGMGLRAGVVLRLGTAAPDRVDLAGPDNLRRAGGRLGQARGMRALRLDEAALPAPRGEGGLAPGLATVGAALPRTGTGG